MLVSALQFGAIAMMPAFHAKVSLGIGLLGWWWSRSWVVLPLSLAVGTLVDLDHTVDYAWYILHREHRLIVPLHSYELAFPLWQVLKRPLGQRAATAIVAAYLVHLVSDELSNCTKPGTYSLIWRFMNGFYITSLSRDPAIGIRGRQEDLDNLRRLVFRVRTVLPGDGITVESA